MYSIGIAEEGAGSLTNEEKTSKEAERKGNGRRG